MSKLSIPERVELLLQTLPYEECDAECQHPCQTMKNAHDDARECLTWQRDELSRLRTLLCRAAFWIPEGVDNDLREQCKKAASETVEDAK